MKQEQYVNGGSEPARALPVPTSTPRKTEREGSSGEEEEAAISTERECVSDPSCYQSRLLCLYLFISLFCFSYLISIISIRRSSLVLITNNLISVYGREFYSVKQFLKLRSDSLISCVCKLFPIKINEAFPRKKCFFIYEKHRSEI